MSNTFQIMPAQFDKGLPGQALHINMTELRGQYDYVGLWYAKDGNQKTLITTELYYGSGSPPEKLLDFNEELKENAFKQVNRFEFSRSLDWICVTTRVDNSRYCKLKMSATKSGRLYINYKILHNKSYGFDILGNGMFKGGQADFFLLGSEDGMSDEDYRDAVMYVVCIKDMPPEDWNVHDTYIGVEHLPIFSTTFKFADDRKYSNWFDQHPLEKLK